MWYLSIQMVFLILNKIRGKHPNWLKTSQWKNRNSTRKIYIICYSYPHNNPTCYIWHHLMTHFYFTIPTWLDLFPFCWCYRFSLLFWHLHHLRFRRHPHLCFQLLSLFCHISLFILQFYLIISSDFYSIYGANTYFTNVLS